MKKTLTIEEVFKIEPRLLALHSLACDFKKLAGKKRVCANAIWYGEQLRGYGMKGIFMTLAGYYAEKPELRSSAVYELAYAAIYDALPDCNHPDSECWG